MDAAAAVLNSSNNSGNCTPPKNVIFTPHGSLSVMLTIATLIPIVCVMGIIGNVGSFIIMKESGKKITSHFFIKVLTVFDCLSLIFFLPPVWLNLVMRSVFIHLWPHHFSWIDDMSSWPMFCEIRLYITFITRTISIYIIVLFTLERALLVLWPYKGRHWCTMKNARLGVVLVFIFSLIVNFPCLFAFGRKRLPVCPSGHRIACVSKPLFFKWRGAAFVILSIFPSVVIGACNAAISITLFRRRRAGYLDDKEKEMRKDIDRAITRRLLLVSTAFIVLNTPLLVTTSVHNLLELSGRRSHKRGAWANAFHISLFLFYLNLAINFVLYCFTGRSFRRAAFALFSCQLTEMRRHRHYLDEPESAPQTGSTATAGLSSRRESDRSPKPSVSGPSSGPIGETLSLTPLRENVESEKLASVTED